jgi:hypothetical protein
VTMKNSCHIVQEEFTDISEEHTAVTFRVKG